MKKRQMLGLSGLFLVLAGVFTPILSVPVLGGLSLYKTQTPDALALIGLSVIGGLFVLNENYRVVRVVGITNLALILIHLIFAQYKLSNVRSSYEESTKDNPFASLGQVFLDSMSLEWGWFVLLLGGVALTASAFLKTVPGDPSPSTPGSEPTRLLPMELKEIWGYVGIGAVIVLLVVYQFAWGTGSNSSALPGFPSKSDSKAADAEESSGSIFGGKKESPDSMTPEEAAYIGKITLKDIKIAETILGDDAVFGEIKNEGERSVDRVEMIVYLLDKDGKRIAEEKFSPVLAGTMFDDDGPLRSGYSRKFGGYKLEAPSDWAKKVDVQIARVKFSE